jgi:hypothetical protein
MAGDAEEGDVWPCDRALLAAGVDFASFDMQYCPPNQQIQKCTLKSNEAKEQLQQQ